MGVNHIAVTVKDIEATHEFYTEAMGFDLVKVEINETGGGFNRHVFYSTGSATDGLIAFWDVSNVPGSENPRTDLNRDLGLEPMMNHFAFQADGLDSRTWHDAGSGCSTTAATCSRSTTAGSTRSTPRTRTATWSSSPC